MCKYSIFNLREKSSLYPLDEILLTSNQRIINKLNNVYSLSNKESLDYVYRRNSFITIDSNYIYEYDLLKVIDKSDNSFFTGIVGFKKGVFYLKYINKDGLKLKEKIALSKLCSSLVYQIMNLGSILETTDSYMYIRDRFFFAKPNGNKEYAIDNNENLYLVNNLNDIVPESRNRLKLSTDVYDKYGELIFECDKVLVSINGVEYKGIISNKVYNGHYLINLTNYDKEDSIIYINNIFNKDKYEYIKLNKKI